MATAEERKARLVDLELVCEDDPLALEEEAESMTNSGWCWFCVSEKTCACCPTCTNRGVTFPDCMGLGTMTGIFALLAIILGALLYDADIQDGWTSCYVSTSNNTPYSCWLKLIYFPGQMWMRVLKCLVVPLMACMVLVLPERLKTIAPVGIRLMCLLTFTSFIAAMEGLLWGNLLKPGDGVSYGCAADNSCTGASLGYISEFESILNVFQLFFPANIVSELANTKIIGIIAFFLVYGIQLQKGPVAWSRPITNMAKGIMQATFRILLVVMWFTPLAMFSLITYQIAQTEDLWNVLEAVGLYLLTQLLGQFVHLVLFYFVFYFIATGNNPLLYFWKIKAAPMTALITSSSAATAPVTLRANREAGCDQKLIDFTINLGAGMNMDGTSLGFPIMVLFTAQVYNIDLNFAKQMTVALLAMVCSLGTAPIPNAGLVFLQMLYLAADLPEEAQAIGFSLITMMDWLVDRVETAQNVTSDSFICGILTHYFQGNTGPLTCCMRGMIDPEVLDGQDGADTGLINGGTKAEGEDVGVL